MNLKKSIVAFLFLLLTVNQLFAAVTVTAGNGGSAISADDKGGAYTLINGPVITESTDGEIGTGTIILNAPAGVIFDVTGTAPTVVMNRAGGSGGDSKNINGVAEGTAMAITSRTTTQITFTVTSASSNPAWSKLTWQNVRVQPNSGAAGTGNITKTGTSVISGVTNGVTNFATVTVVPGALNKMQLLMSGESASPGAGIGKTGTPSAQIAGAAFNVTVNAVDQYWNIVNTTNTANITSSDVNAILPADADLVAGTKVFGIELRTAGSRTVTASNFTAPSITANTSPSTTINAASFSKLQLLMPGETADPGSATGKTGSPTAQTAGTSFNVTVNAVDANWNLVSSTNTIGITSSDVNATLPANAALVAGTLNYSVTFKTAGSATITSTNITDGSKTANTSPSTTVNAGAFAKMQLIVPGETAVPGTGSGKTGTAYTQSVGSLFSVTVNAVDANWNLVSSTNTVGITSTDGTATLPSNAALVAGTKNYNVTFNAAGSFTLTATNITDGTKTLNTSPSLTATLSILSPATGGSSISADNTGGSYTSLTGAVYSEGVSGDVGTGTIILNAPSGVIFDVGGTAPTLLMSEINGIGGDADNINGLADDATIALTSISTSQITFTITSASKSGATCKLTFQNVRVRPSTGAAIAGKLFKTGTSTIAGVINSVTNFGNVNVVAGAFTKMQLLVPGETASPGAGSGKTGSPTAAAAGTAFNITVNAVDQYWNVVNTTNTVGITSSDVNASLPANTALVAGTKTLSVNLKTVGTRTVTATNITDGSKTANTSPSITVNTGAFAKLQLLMPGETAAAGTASGKTGTPTAQTAGISFTVTVNAVDASWNIVSSTNTIAITSSGLYATLPANAALVSGSRTFSVTLNAVGTRTVTASNVTDGTKTANTSPSTTVNVGAFAKMQILIPGETANPGSPTGKTGTPDAQSKGKPFTVTVNSVDAAWNLVSSTNTIAITSSDGTATLPANAALVAGTQTFNVTFNASSGTATVTATNVTDGSKTANTSPATTIVLATWDLAAGGSAISADNTGGSYTTLTGPVYYEGLNGDVGTGTIILNAPTGFIFDNTATPTLLMNNIAGGTQTARQINGLADASSIALTSISTTQITFTITSASNSGSFDKLTFQNVKVRPSTGIVGSGNLTISGTALLAGISASTNLGTLNVVAGAFTKMQLLTPGETAVPGAGSGKTGTPSVQTAGTAFNVTVNAVDQYWNLVSSTNTVGITSSDVNATLPANALLVAGTNTYSVTLKSAGTRTVTATNVTDGTKTLNTSPSITVNGGVFTKMQILLPGESADPGSASGKTGTPTAQTAGASFVVTVNSVDSLWNLVSSVTNTAGITSTDANATLPANAALVSGTKTFSITPKTAGTPTVTATNITDGTKTANTSPAVTVNAGAFTKMQLLVPGETADPGSASGKTGTPSGQTPSSSFNVTVNAVDANWNLVSSTNTVGITSTDGTATLPANAALVAGSQTFAVTFNALGSFTVTATNITDGSKTLNTSPSITAGPIVWTGGAGTTFWGDATNWDPVGVPTSINNLNLTGANTIEVNVDATINDLTLNNASLSFTVNAGKSLTINGVLTKTAGSFSPVASSTVIFNSASSQTIPQLNYGGLSSTSTGDRVFTTGTTNIAGDFTIGTNSYTTTGAALNFNGTTAQTITGKLNLPKMIIDNAAGVTMATDSIIITDLLTLTNGALTTNGKLLLEADSIKTATMNGAAGSVSGDVTLKRYLKNDGCTANGYMHLASPITSGLTLNDWHNDGLIMTGLTGGSTFTTWTNVYTYSESANGVVANGYLAATNVTNSLSRGAGYFIYAFKSALGVSNVITNVKGPISLDNYTWNNSPTADEGLITYTNYGLTNDDGWNMIGNPFPAAIDWNDGAISRTNVNNAVYSWKECNKDYATYVGGVGTYGHTGIIPYSQSFFIKATSANPILTVPRSAISAQSGTIFKKATIPNVLYLTITNGQDEDQLAIRFSDKGTIGFDSDLDARKFGYPTNKPSMYTELTNSKGESTNYAINTMPVSAGAKGLKIKHRVATKGKYKLRINGLGSFANQACILIEDLKTGTLIDPKVTPEYSFDEDKTTDYMNRFVVKFVAGAEPKILTEACSQDNKVVFNVGANAFIELFNEKNALIKSASNVDSVVLNNLPVGSYTVKSMNNDAACPITINSFEIVKKIPLEVSLLKRADATCFKNNGLIKVLATGGNGNYQFDWSNGNKGAEISSLKSGLYNVTVTDGLGCIKKPNAISIANIAVKADFDLDKDELIVSKNEVVQATNQSENATNYLWDFGNGNIQYTKTPTAVKYKNEGEYHVKLIVSTENNCSDSITKKIIVKSTVFGNNDLEKDRIIVYQSSDKLIIKSLVNFNGTIELVNIIGKSIYNQNQSIAAESTIEIDMASYNGGIYFVKTSDNQKQLVNKVFFIK